MTTRDRWRLAIQLSAMAFPWRLRRLLLCGGLGFRIDRQARMGRAVILAREFEMGPMARIGHLVLCKPIDRLVLGPDSGIGTGTFITGFPRETRRHFAHLPDRRCELVLARGVGVTGRHYIDCNGGVYIGEFTTVGGLQTQILTHSIDIYRNRQHAAPVRIGKYCFVGTRCTILPGAGLPDYSVLGAGSVLNKAHAEEGFLYAGAPAVKKKKLTAAEIPWMARTSCAVE
jgi:acetyltransferase-like isoleucine patch superfamily enzyme